MHTHTHPRCLDTYGMHIGPQITDSEHREARKFTDFNQICCLLFIYAIQQKGIHIEVDVRWTEKRNKQEVTMKPAMFPQALGM